MTAALTARQACLRPAIRWAVGAVCFVLSMLLSSNDAFATCGDYLHSKSMRAHHQPMANHDASPATNSGDQTSVPARTPCNGPQCQNREPVPFAPMPIPMPVTQRSIDDALPSLNPAHSLNEVRQGVEYHEAALGASDGFVGRLERPPRQ